MKISDLSGVGLRLDGEELGVWVLSFDVFFTLKSLAPRFAAKAHNIAFAARQSSCRQLFMPVAVALCLCDVE